MRIYKGQRNKGEDSGPPREESRDGGPQYRRSGLFQGVRLREACVDLCGFLRERVNRGQGGPGVQAPLGLASTMPRALVFSSVLGACRPLDPGFRASKGLSCPNGVPKS
jgi:hypothetical protein